MSLEAVPIVGGFAGGGLIGALIGFAFKKMMKVAAALVGLQLAILAGLEQKGLISVDWEGVQAGLSSFSNFGVSAGETAMQATPSILDTLVATSSIGGGFALGAAVGFKKG